MASGGVNSALSRRGIHLRVLAQRAATAAVLPFGLKVLLLNRLGHALEPDARIAASVIITGRHLRMGAGSYVNQGCLLDATAPLDIGRRVHIGHRSMVLTTTHDAGTPEQRAGATRALPISIGDGAWLGAGVIVLPGAVIGEGPLAPHALHAGIPASERRLMVPRPGVL
jgi:acetyltransferase-like isoleucine patch superfamily enzyme